MSIKRLVLISIFVALTAIFSQLAIPLVPVPVNLALLAVLLAGAFLGSKDGTIAMVVYVLLGAVGAPVFSKFGAGLGHLFGPTGGYIFGYILAAFLCGLLLEKLSHNFLSSILAMFVAVLACYTLGTVWYAIYTNIPLWTAVTSCVVPFLLGDALKIIAATLCYHRLYHLSSISINKRRN